MNNQVKANLQHLYKSAFDKIRDASVCSMLDELIVNNPDAFFPNEGVTRKLFDIELLEKTKQNQQLSRLFEQAKQSLGTSDVLVVSELKHDILESLEEIKKSVRENKIDSKLQIIFITHNYDPEATFYGFGVGDYPILQKPEYIQYDYEQEVFYAEGEVSYERFWSSKIKLEEILEDLNLDRIFWHSTQYQAFLDAYKYKTKLLLHEAFDAIPLEAFNGVSIELPLYIYANEHDCEEMNVYIYEE